MNIAFIETLGPNGVIGTRATLTDLNREAVEETLEGSPERLESFLYGGSSGPSWPCGPSPEDWDYLCRVVVGRPRLRRTLEAALAASRHRLPFTRYD